MAAWVLLLRGVGGPVQVPPRLLRAALAADGSGFVAVHGHTGNAVLTSDLPRDELLARAAAVCRREFGFQKDLHLVTGADWEDLVACNPFPQAVERPSTLHAAILGAEPDPDRVAAIRSRSDGQDGLAVIGRVAYLHTPQGFSKSRIAATFDRGIGVPTTARNWSTVGRLLALVEKARATEPA